MLWFVAVMAVMSVVLIFCAIRTAKSGKRLAPYVERCLLWLLVPMAANIGLALTNDMDICKFCYTVYFISTSVLLMFFDEFALEYCGFEFKKSALRPVLYGIVMFDCISLSLNYLFGHAFDVMVLPEKTSYDGLYVVIVSLWYHKVHLVISALLIIMAIVALAYKVVKTPRVYRSRYSMILLAYSVTIIWEALHIIRNEVVDRSVMGFVACGIFLYVYAIEYVPSTLAAQMKTTVIETISEGLVFFDIDRNCIYINSAARLQLDMGPNDSTGVCLDKLLALTGEDREKSAEYESKKLTCSKFDEGEESIYELEFHKLHDMNSKVIGSFVKIYDMTERVKHERLNEFMATHDRLTGIYNLERFNESVREVLDSNPDKEFYIVASDIKEFKLVNDRYGREYGDRILIRIAELLKSKAVSDTTRYGRIGIDKFGILIEKQNFEEETFLTSVNEVPNVGRNLVIPVIIHIGVYEPEDRSMPVSAMFDRAFIAIEGIKNDAEQRLAYYEDSARNELLWSQRITEQLDTALQTGQIVPYLQAQVSNDGKMIGAEALVRWIHPDEGFLPPGRFIGILEKNGMVAKVDRFIWEYACRILRRWSFEGRDDLYLSVNISPKDFYMMDVPAEIIALADKYELDRKRLRLEITETMMMQDSEEKIKTIDRLRDAGFIVEMDDFGSGYSSLNMLKDMPVDVLKLDMVFLKDDADSERNKKIMSLIINLAKSLDVKVIAEGVETADQADMLTNMGCDIFQGYYFAKPISVDEYEKKYKVS